jgi:hypothetical protein
MRRSELCQSAVDFVEADDSTTSNGMFVATGGIRRYLGLWIGIVVFTTQDGIQGENEKTTITFEF